MAAIKTYELTKYYGKTRGILNLNLEVPQGLLFGFLGANGAGKTTAIRVLMGLLKPTSGRVQVLDRTFDGKNRYHPAVNRKIGFLPGELRLYEDMTGADYLQYMGEFFGRIQSSIQSLAVEALELSKKELHRPISGYSRGMKQKLGIIQAIQHDPVLLIMDEPTEGLDPLMQKHFYQLLFQLNQKGQTVFMSSHNLAEVERVCERIAIIRDGELVAVEDVEDLKARRLYTVEMAFFTEEEAQDFDPPGGESIRQEGRRLSFRWKGDFQDLFSHLSQSSPQDFTCAKASLEEIFLTYYAGEEVGDDRDEQGAL